MRTSESRLVTHRQHPTLPIEIRSYNKRAFFRKAWNEETINSRGHVVTLDGTPVSRPFTKFLNIGETDEFSRENVERMIELHRDEVLFNPKLNGHFAQLFEYEGQWINTTKGSFEHDFIEPDRALIERAGLTDDALARMNPNWTFLFEILGNHDRHMLHDIDVESYAHEGESETAVIIGVFDRQTWSEVPEREVFEVLRKTADVLDLPIPPMVEGFTYGEVASALLDLNEDRATPSQILDALYDSVNCEGMVIQIPSLCWRVKLKTHWFIRNRYMRQMTNTRVAQIIKKQREDEKIYARIPEELHDEMDEIMYGVKNQHRIFLEEFHHLSTCLHDEGFVTKDEMIDEYRRTSDVESSDVWITTSRTIDLIMFKAFFTGHDALFDATVDMYMAATPEHSLVRNHMREDLL
ncbi:MAG: hypothetical protein CMF22_11615 [Idiomarinaceae bacterium]|nr:hypothetical protein [Idiomarinaceae bacterium]|tara:strand:- start:70402 stop:71628 length:1227 start_codon:yes stop_codon:yes gene_type:complete